MAADENRERDAEEWADGVIEDISDEPEPNEKLSFSTAEIASSLLLAMAIIHELTPSVRPAFCTAAGVSLRSYC